MLMVGSTKTWNPECGIRKRNHGNGNRNGNRNVIRERRFQAIDHDLKKKISNDKKIINNLGRGDCWI